MPRRAITANRPKLTKQRDVAELAGVSNATVSLVLAGRTDRVSEPTRQKVFEAIRRLEYRAPALDNRVQGQQNRLIGLLAPNLGERPLTRDFNFRSHLDSVLTECLKRNWGVAVMADTIWDDSGRSIRRAYDGRCDGMLIIAPEEDEMVQPFLDRGVPIVQLGITKRQNLASCVDVDNPEIGCLAARKFVEAGHQRLGFLGMAGATTSVERLHAFLEEASKLGASVQVFESEDWDPSSRLKTLLPSWVEEDITGIFSWCDGYACYLYKALARLKLRVPRDLSVISVDGTLSNPLRPGLSGFSLPFEEIAKCAVDLLIQQIEAGDRTPQSRRFSATYVSRSSLAQRHTNT